MSLLWPDGTRPAQTCTALDPQCVRDLELEATLAAFTDSRLGRSTIRAVFLHLCTDPAVIAYRQDILDDLWCNPDFTAHLEALLPDLQALDTAHIAIDRRRSSLQEITCRLGELEHLVNCVTGLSTVFAQVGDKVRIVGYGFQSILIHAHQWTADGTVTSMGRLTDGTPAFLIESTLRPQNLAAERERRR